MIIAGLAASGTTEIDDIYYVERGYDDIVGKLNSVGANIVMRTVPDVVSFSKAT